MSDGENTAAVDDSDSSDDRSRVLLGSSSSASISGRAMASPVIISELAFSASTSRHTSWGSKLRHQHDLVALEALPHHRPLGGAVHEGGDGQEGEREAHLPAPLDQSSGAWARSPVSRSMPPPEGEHDVLVAPHHALGHAGGAAGVEDVPVVAGPGGEVALGAALGHGLLEVAADDEPVAEVGHVAGHPGDPVGELGVVDEGLEVGVAEQVGELVLDVAVVDVDPDGPELEDRPQALDPLDRVEAVDADVVARPDALVGEVVGEPVGPLRPSPRRCGAARRRPGTRARRTCRPRARTGRPG